jgi:hypothetical protein
MTTTPKDEARTDPPDAKVQAVDDENRRIADRTMPGRRAALPPGALLPRPPEPQGDENRDGPLDRDGRPRAPDKPPLIE